MLAWHTKQNEYYQFAVLFSFIYIIYPVIKRQLNNAQVEKKEIVQAYAHVCGAYIIQADVQRFIMSILRLDLQKELY